MQNLYARTVFFVTDAERARSYYTDTLGFALDWDSKDGVFQVSLLGFELILNDTWENHGPRPGQGRIFIGLEDDQAAAVRAHIREKGLQTYRVEWGRPTLVLKDLDGNQLFFWIPNDDFTGLGKEPIITTTKDLR